MHNVWVPRARAIAIAAAVASTIVRVWLAHTYYGFQTGDDLEIAEEAFRRAVGLRHTPWEIRSLFIPDLIAPFVRVASLFVHDRLLLSILARYPFIILTGVNVVLVYLVGRRWYGEAAGATASVLYAAHWMPLVYGSSLFPRALAVTCILYACLLLGREDSGRRAFLAGLLAALALTARYSEAVFALSLLVITRKRLHFIAGFLAGVVVFVGVFDALTGGRPFGSLIAFARLTFIARDASSRVVEQPMWWYLANLAHWMPLTLLPFLFVRPDTRRLGAFVLLPLAVLSLVYHKELRYMQVIVPFALIIAAQGFVQWWQQPRRRALAATLLVLAIPLAAARAGGAARRSTNAVDAARWMSERGVRAVALSQAWAYGGQLFLGNNVAVHEVRNPPDLLLLRQALVHADCAGLYAADLTNEVTALVESAGFVRALSLDGRGRAVVIFLPRHAALGSSPFNVFSRIVPTTIAVTVHTMAIAPNEMPPPTRIRGRALAGPRHRSAPNCNATAAMPTRYFTFGVR